MYKQILFENENKRLDYPLSRLLCLAMFTIWQMGFIYYMGPALTIQDKTPLPIDMDSTTAIIAAGYVMSILLLVLMPKKYIYAARGAAITALITAVGVILPLSPEVLALLLYIQCFCCCFMIGFESATIMFLLSEKSAILYLLVGYGFSFIVIAILQNDIASLSFGIFRWALFIMICLLLYFYMKLPVNSFPVFAERKRDWSFPAKLFAGTYLFIFFACLLAVIGPAAAAGIRHGVFTAYLSAAAAALIMFFLHKKAAIHPLRSVTVAVGLGVIGFVLLYAANYMPSLALPACILLGVGYLPCALVPLFGLELMRTYPSRLIPAITMAFAVIAVLVQSALVDAFREYPELLSITYLVLIIVMAVVYMLLEPMLLHSLHEKYAHHKTSESVKQTQVTPFSQLTSREVEVADLMCRGYSNRDIAKMLFISEHTVKDHSKNIYRKLNVHSRFELAALMNRSR